MNYDDVLDAVADAHGILPEFTDLSGNVHSTNPDTKRALLRAQGVQLDNHAVLHEALREIQSEMSSRVCKTEVIVEAGRPVFLKVRGSGEWHLVVDRGGQITAAGKFVDQLALPAMAIGAHALTIRHPGGTQDVTILAAPAKCQSVADITGRSKVWGLNAALYGLQSDRNVGLGDYEDLARLAETIGSSSASFLGINPIHNMGWADKVAVSPYSPSHRGFFNTAYIALDKIPGLEGNCAAQIVISGLKPQESVSQSGSLIDYAAHGVAHRGALRKLYSVFQSEAPPASRELFEGFCQTGAQSLHQFARFEVTSVLHGSDWRYWADDVWNSTNERKLEPQNAPESDVKFHCWLQWVAHVQVSAAQSRAKDSGMPLGLYLDLAVGARRGGAESLCEATTIATGVSIGAPPDHLSPAGQNWNLAAYAPNELRRSKFAALRRVLQQSMSVAGILRIDHVLGMNRSFWIPDDGSPGGYVTQPFDALLAVIAIEASRAGTVVIGEDLGLVPAGFREEIAQRGLYSYSVLQYEKENTAGRFRKPAALAGQSLACFGTHDTPTAKGYFQGRDVDMWRQLGWVDDEGAQASRRLRKLDTVALTALVDRVAAEVGPEDDFECFRTAVHTAIASSAAAMVSVQLDDVLGVADAQNIPGTIDEHPNWRRRSGIAVDSIAQCAGFIEAAEIMSKYGRSSTEKTLKEENS